MGHRRSIVDKLGVSIGWKKLYHTPGVGFHNPKRFCLALRPTVLAGMTSVLANLEKDDSSRYNGDRSKVFQLGRAGRAMGERGRETEGSTNSGRVSSEASAHRHQLRGLPLPWGKQIWPPPSRSSTSGKLCCVGPTSTPHLR